MEENTLDKAQFEMLKNTNYQEASFYFLDLVRGKLNMEDSFEKLVAASVLALKLKDTSNEKLLEEIKKDLYDETVLRTLKLVWNEFFKEIKTYSNNFSEDELKGVILFSEPYRFSDINVSQTPNGINKLAISLLDLKKGDRVLDLGSGVSSFLIEAAMTIQTEYNYGVEINSSNVVISKLKQYITELPIEILQGNIVSKDYSHLNANKVFSNFPLGMRYKQLTAYIKNNNKLNHYFENSSRVVTGDWVYAMASYLNTSMPGRTVFLMTNSGTFNTADMEFRQELIEKKLIEGIIQLPAKLLSSTAIPLTLVVLSEGNKKIKMVDASNLFNAERRQNILTEKNIKAILKAYKEDSDISQTVSEEDIRNKDYIIHPSRYVGIEEVQNGIELDEVAKSINRGAMIKSNELDDLISDEETNKHYLMLQNIQDGLIESNLPSLKEIDEKNEKYCITNNNVIISKNAPFKIALAHVNKEEEIIANGNLYFIELDESKVDPTFVVVYLQSEEGQSQLNRLSKGSVMKNISIKDLKKVQIPQVDMEKQKNIAEEYNKLGEQLVMLQKQIDLVKNKRLDLMKEEG